MTYSQTIFCLQLGSRPTTDGHEQLELARLSAVLMHRVLADWWEART